MIRRPLPRDYFKLRCLMIRLKRYRLADATLVMSLGTAPGTTELGLAGQPAKQPGVGHSTDFCVFA